MAEARLPAQRSNTLSPPPAREVECAYNDTQRSALERTMTTDLTLARLNELSSPIAESGYSFIKDARLDGAPVVIVEAYRTQQRQDALYAQGRTKPGAVVTWTRSSMHTRRRAFDIAFVVNGKLTFDVPRTWWDYMGARSSAYGLRWGPSIGLVGDLGHYEL